MITEAEIEYVLHLENVHHGILECAFCNPAVANRGQRMLPTFETLAAHVRHFHPEKFQDCVEDSVGAIPAKAFQWYKSNSGEITDMALARPVVSSPAGGPSPRTNNWLRDTDVSTSKQNVKIIDARPDESGRAAVVLKLKLANGETRLDSLKANNPNFKILFDAFGEDEKGWKNKNVLLFLEYDEFSERNWRRYSTLNAKS